MPKRKVIKIIIDTNLLISFLIGKRLKRLKNFIVYSNVELIFCEQCIIELKTVTKKPKLHKYFNQKDVDDLVDLFYLIGNIYKVDSEPEICRDPKDNFLLALAKKSKADYLITGDNDLLILKNHKNTKIITINEFEKIICF